MTNPKISNLTQVQKYVRRNYSLEEVKSVNVAGRTFTCVTLVTDQSKTEQLVDSCFSLDWLCCYGAHPHESINYYASSAPERQKTIELFLNPDEVSDFNTLQKKLSQESDPLVQRAPSTCCLRCFEKSPENIQA